MDLPNYRLAEQTQRAHHGGHPIITKGGGGFGAIFFFKIDVTSGARATQGAQDRKMFRKH